ncbi:MAG: hypothetical protein GY940_46465 [bacterium]|nr:hypothetical protein [bacterium]
MKCKNVEELISMYIEGEVPEETDKEISLHLEQCPRCRQLKETVEELLGVFPELEEEVPFFLKNRLYYIPESQEVEELPESRFHYLKWVAAAIGTFVLFLNLFYFTNIYPPAHRFLHTAVSKIQTFTVETGAFFERLKESKSLTVFSLFEGDPDGEDDGEGDGEDDGEGDEDQTDNPEENPLERTPMEGLDIIDDPTFHPDKIKPGDGKDNKEKEKQEKKIEFNSNSDNKDGGNNG